MYGGFSELFYKFFVNLYAKGQVHHIYYFKFTKLFISVIFINLFIFFFHLLLPFLELFIILHRSLLYQLLFMSFEPLLQLWPKMSNQTLYWPSGTISQSTNSMIFNSLTDFPEHINF